MQSRNNLFPHATIQQDMLQAYQPAPKQKNLCTLATFSHTGYTTHWIHFFSLWFISETLTKHQLWHVFDDAITIWKKMKAGRQNKRYLKSPSSAGCHAKNIYKHNPQLPSCYLVLLMCMRGRALRISLHPLSLPSGVVSNDASSTDTAESTAAD